MLWEMMQETGITVFNLNVLVFQFGVNISVLQQQSLLSS